MTSERSCFSAISTENVRGMVNFGDGRKSKILGKGKIMAIGDVRFTKTQCVVNDKEGASGMLPKCVSGQVQITPGSLASSVRPHELSRFDQIVQKRMCKRIT
ncbi:unnamed protein product [Prunus armeniaca]